MPEICCQRRLNTQTSETWKCTHRAVTRIRQGRQQSPASAVKFKRAPRCSVIETNNRLMQFSEKLEQKHSEQNTELLKRQDQEWCCAKPFWSLRWKEKSMILSPFKILIFSSLQILWINFDFFKNIKVFKKILGVPPYILHSSFGGLLMDPLHGWLGRWEGELLRIRCLLGHSEKFLSSSWRTPSGWLYARGMAVPCWS